MALYEKLQCQVYFFMWIFLNNKIYSVLCDPAEQHGESSFWYTFIRFASPLRTGSKDSSKFPLVCLEYLTNWLVLKATKNSTVTIALIFFKNGIVPYIYALKIFVSEIVTLLHSEVVDGLYKVDRNKLEHTLCNCFNMQQQCRVNGLYHKARCWTACARKTSWLIQVLQKVVFEHRGRPQKDEISLLELLFRVKPQPIPNDEFILSSNCTSERSVDLLYAAWFRANCVIRMKKTSPDFKLFRKVFSEWSFSRSTKT